jgi:sarcosine oxidase subunit beta
VARIVVAGAGAVGASIAYHLALLGAGDVVLADAGDIASGSTGKAMGGIRQQFSTAAEVRLARDSIQFFEELGPEYFQQVGYLFVATTEAGLADLEARRELQAGLGVPVESVDPAGIDELAPGTNTADVLGGAFCQTDGVADPPAVTREIVRRAAERGVEVRERTRAEELEADTLVIACGAWSAGVASGFGVELPIRPLCRQLLETGPLPGLPCGLPMVIESETGFHYRRRDDCLRIAMPDPAPRWGFEETVDESLFPDRLARLANRFPATGGTDVARAWAGLYDMTPDAHPIVDRIGDGLYAACGFSGHGFMQSPAVGRALAEWIVEGTPSADLSPYRLERFSGATAADVETLVL